MKTEDLELLHTKHVVGCEGSVMGKIVYQI
jgi:hypothetical protein